MNTQKPVELLQAQVALYAERQSELMYPGRSRALFALLGEAGMHNTDISSYATYPRSSAKKVFSDGKVVIQEPVGTALPLFDKQEYASFLKNHDIRKQSKNLAKMITNYEQFAPIVAKMNLPFNDYDASGKHSSMLGRGSNKAAFGFKAMVEGSEKELVAIIDHAPNNAFAQVKIGERAANLALVKGRPGFEQGIAWSNDPPLVIAERAPGVGLDILTPEQKSRIPSNHWDDLATNVANVADIGIELDPMPGNFFYDSNAGFTVIDFRRSAAGKAAQDHSMNMKDIEYLRYGKVTQ